MVVNQQGYLQRKFDKKMKEKKLKKGYLMVGLSFVGWGFSMPTLILPGSIDGRTAEDVKQELGCVPALRNAKL